MPLNINVRLGWLDGERPDDTAKELLEIRQMLRLLIRGQGELKEQMMSLAADFKTFADKMDAETTRIGQLVTDLSGQIKNSLTDEEVAGLKAQFGAIADHLTAIGKDPTDPVPPGPVTP